MGGIRHGYTDEELMRDLPDPIQYPRESDIGIVADALQCRVPLNK
jgi:hypothetical protein